MRQLCINIVCGNDNFIGYKINAKHKRALYVSTEDGRDAIASLLYKQNMGVNYIDRSFENLNYLFDTSNLIQELDEILIANKHDIIIIDAFADLFGKDMNQSNHVRCFLNEFGVLAEKHECLFVFIHHTGKASENKSPHKGNLLGSQGIEAKMRAVIILTKHNTNPHLRYFSIVKGNYLSGDLKNEATELHFNENMIFSNTGKFELNDNLTKDESQKYREDQIRKLHSDGKSQSAIAVELGVSQATVSRSLAPCKASPIRA